MMMIIIIFGMIFCKKGSFFFHDYSGRSKVVDAEALLYVQFLGQAMRSKSFTSIYPVILGMVLLVFLWTSFLPLVISSRELSRYIEKSMFFHRCRCCCLFNLPKCLVASSNSLTDLELKDNLECEKFKTMFKERTTAVFPSYKRLSILVVSSRLTGGW